MQIDNELTDTRRCHLTRLPTELFSLVYSFLTPKQLIESRRLSKHFCSSIDFNPIKQQTTSATAITQINAATSFSSMTSSSSITKSQKTNHNAELWKRCFFYEPILDQTTSSSSTRESLEQFVIRLYKACIPGTAPCCTIQKQYTPYPHMQHHMMIKLVDEHTLSSKQDHS
jgi:hypothetical protein